MALAVQLAVIFIGALIVAYVMWRLWGRSRWESFVRKRKSQRRQRARPVSMFVPVARKAYVTAAENVGDDAVSSDVVLSQALLSSENTNEQGPGPAVHFVLPLDSIRSVSINDATRSIDASHDRVVSSSTLNSAATVETSPAGYRSSMRWGLPNPRNTALSEPAKDSTKGKRFSLSVRFEGLCLTLKSGSKAKVRKHANFHSVNLAKPVDRPQRRYFTVSRAS